MRVNSVFTGIFINRMLVGPLMLVIFFTTSSFTHPSNPSDRESKSKHVNLLIRHIGHRLLLQAGDQTSLVLPVTEIKEGTFLLTFEKPFFFSHDSLIAMSQEYFIETLFPSGYTVTVQDCMKSGIVYGFEVNNTQQDILGCRGRKEPFGCYTIEFTFPDFYASIEEEKADVESPTEEVMLTKPAVGEVKPKLKKSEALKSTTADPPNVLANADQAVGLKSIKVDNPKPEELKATTSDSPSINLVYGGIVVLLGVTLLIGRFGKILKPMSAQDRDNTIIKESGPELTTLGKFKFDVKGQRLLFGSEAIPLTDKECKILELLNQSFGELIPRETLMQKVWIDEGVITGRSLDMFVSKLRKKLSSDPELRITNVHGKGYKLETNYE